MSGHTPGPWRVWEKDSSVVVDQQNHRTATASGGADHTFPNARLIAAAPDLLDALKAVAAAYEYKRQGSIGIGPMYTPPYVQAVRDAIAKAEGGPEPVTK